MRLGQPPGHHVYAEVVGNCCFLNNSAIVTNRLHAIAASVVILDVES